MEKACEAILALKPVTFHYKKEVDPHRMPQLGLVAEDVEKVNPNLVATLSCLCRETLRYSADSRIFRQFGGQPRSKKRHSPAA
jgi:hypothetical protein